MCNMDVNINQHWVPDVNKITNILVFFYSVWKFVVEAKLK